MHPLRDKCAIVGVGASPQGKIPGSTALSLAVEAFKRALDEERVPARAWRDPAKEELIDACQPAGEAKALSFGPCSSKSW